jgi:hypothetical protein
MKNKIYYIGILSGMITACGCLFKILHWPGAAIIIITGLVSLSLVFLPLAVVNMIKAGQTKNNRNFYILVAIVMAFNFMAALFKIMHWPGGEKILMISIPLPFVVLLPAYILSNSADKEVNYKNLLAIMFFFAYFSAITGLLAIGISTDVVDGLVRSAIDTENKTMALKENTRLVAGFSDINNPVSKEAEKLCSKINEIKRLVCKKKLEYPPEKSDTFPDVRPVIEKRYLTELKTGIRNFKVLVQRQCGSDSRIYRYVDDTFDLYDDVSDDVHWEDTWISNNIIASATESLNVLEFKLRLVEMESYDFLKK